MLGDAAKIQQEDAAYLNRKRQPGEPAIEPLYLPGNVYQTLLRLRAIGYDTPTTIGPGIELTFADAGHLLGSATVHLRLSASTGERRLTFTGDLGRPGLPILRAPAPVPPADLIVCESTYGGHTHEPVEETAEQLGQIVCRTARRGGKLIIPAFSVGRTQTVVYFLHQLISAGRLSELPIFVDSPMAVRATEVYRGHPECFNEQTCELLARHADLFGEQRIRYIDKVHESIALNHFSGPCVIISASGMCEAGRVVHHLKHHLDDPRSTVLLVGYQAMDTLGRRLVEGRSPVRVLGREVPVRAEIVSLPGLSSHADQPGILRALAGLAAPGRKVRLVHGELPRAEPLAQALRTAGFEDVCIPEPGDSVVV